MMNTSQDRGLLGDVALVLTIAVAMSGAAGCGGEVIGNEGDLDGSAKHDTGGPDAQQHDSGQPEASAEAQTDAAPEAAADTAPPKGLVTVPLSGCVPTYTAGVQIGGGQTFQLVLDTGSTTLGVASSTCTDCFGLTPLYTPGATAVDQHQTAMSEYESGNTWSGEIYEDTVGTGTPEATTSVKLAGITTQNTFFEPVVCGSTPLAYEGIIGFAPAGAAVNGTNGYFDDLVAGGFTPNIFAIQLCDSGGTLWLGGWDPTHVTAPVQYVPMSASFLGQYAYVVNLAQIVVNGTTVPVPSGEYQDSILDTGTSIFILNTDAYNAVTAAITSDSEFQSIVSSDPTWFDNPDGCVTLSQTKAELDAMLPPLTLDYGTSPSVSITAVATESYLYPYAGEWCPALYSYASSGDFPFAGVLGSPVLKSSVTVFDRAGSRFGFAPHSPCP
jgi:hypothetical protein